MEPAAVIGPDDRPRIDPEVVWIDVEGQIIAVHRVLETVHHVTESGALLWPLLDGRATVRDIADDVRGVFGIDADAALDDVLRFVESLRAEALVTTGE